MNHISLFEKMEARLKHTTVAQVHRREPTLPVKSPKRSTAPTINQITLSPFNITLTLGITALLLVFASITGQLIKYVLGHDTAYGFTRLFFVDAEGNIPSYFSASLLLLAALFLALIAALKKAAQAAYRFQWTLLSFTFLFMAIDEAASIHELLIVPMRSLLGHQARGLFWFAWVIPGIALTLAFGLCYLRFLLHLPAKTRLRFVIAATLYLGGAIGMELVGGRYAYLHGMETLAYSMVVTVEESLEMTGVIMFIYALLNYLADNFKETRLRLDNFDANSPSLTSKT
ncbi:MAG: hypothetical protein HY038_01315 [Nitrospirae bacterium]|nr:hypothetical protein [Nitrospirota bacterium]